MGIERASSRLTSLKLLIGSPRRAVLAYLWARIDPRPRSRSSHRSHSLLTAVCISSILLGLLRRTPEQVSVERLAPGQAVTIAARPHAGRRRRRAT